MTKRPIGIAGLLLLMIAVGVWVVLPKHGGSSGSVVGGPAAKIPVHEPQAPLAGASTRPVTTSDLWTRPTAKVAARHLRRVRFAGLRRLGASEQLVDRPTDGDILAVVTELKDKAKRGDPSAANIYEQYRMHYLRSMVAGHTRMSQGSDLKK